MKKDAYYFPHDSNAKDDPKIMLLIEELGLEGFGIFWVLIEELRNQKGYKYPLKLLKVLARRYNTTEAKMQTVVRNYELFEFTEDEFFFSNSLMTRMQFLDDKRKRRQLAGAKGGRKKADNAKAELKQLSSNAKAIVEQSSSNAKAKPQQYSDNALPSKVKESKVKESKVKEIGTNVPTCVREEKNFESSFDEQPNPVKDKEEKKEERKSSAKKKEEKPEWEEFQFYAKEKANLVGLELDPISLRLKFESWRDSGWINGKTGKTIQNWKSTLSNSLKYLTIEKTTNHGTHISTNTEKPNRSQAKWDALQDW